MFLRPILRATACTSSLGLSLSQTTQRSLFSTASRQLSPLCPQTPSKVSRVATSGRTQPHPLLLTTLFAGSFTAFLATRPVTYNDTSPVADFSSSAYSHGKDAKVPLSKDGGRSLNPRAIRQISMGSIIGLGLGVVVSAFSKMIVLIGGVGIVVWQLAARRGYNIIPVERAQRYVKGINLRAAINDNAAFKISFGLMFALTALGEF